MDCIKQKHYGDFICFFYINTDNKYIKNKNVDEVSSHNDKKIILYFKNNAKQQKYCKHLDYKIQSNLFPYDAYLKLNPDLVKINSKDKIWNHWKQNGINEERTYTYINNSSIHNGRLGNIFFINMYLHFISIKYDLKCYYKFYKIFNMLGISFNKGKNIYKYNTLINDENFLNVLKSKELPKSNLIIKDAWFQTKKFCNVLKHHFKSETVKSKIISNNIYKSRYNNNNDLFVHLRLGDVKDITKQKINYYIELLGKIKYNKAYISSDFVNDPLCLLLIEKFQLCVIDYNEVETIMFGSTCNNIVLSGGTFSWLIGFLAFFTKNIYYPDIEQKWYGDIFSSFDWTKIN